MPIFKGLFRGFMGLFSRATSRLSKNTKKKEEEALILLSLVGLAVAAYIFLLGARQPAGESFLNRLRALPRAEQQRVAAKFIAANNLSRCQMLRGLIIDGLDSGTVCQNNVAYNLALTKKDPTYCQKLDDKLFSIKDCELQAIALEMQTSEALIKCQNYKDADLRLACDNAYWSGQAKKRARSELCKNVSLGESRTRCQDDVSAVLLAKDPDVVSCRQFSNAVQSDCEKFKKSVSDGQPCDNIVYPALKAACEAAVLKK